MAYETEVEREAARQAKMVTEAANHKKHLESPFLEKPAWFSDSLDVFHISPPEIPATPTAQNIVDVLVTLGFATQAEA